MAARAKTYAVLRNGSKMPLIGLGTWPSSAEQLETALPAALDAGYRHVDCAYNYRNESYVGAVLKKCFDAGKVKREDLFITSKLPMIGNRASSVEKFLKKSLQDLQMDYVDLYLIHFPVGMQDTGNWEAIVPRGEDGRIKYDMDTDLDAVWKAMEAQVDAGRTRAIGVSDFNCSQVMRIMENAHIKPVVWQMELHAYHQQVDARELCRRHDIVVTAASPLGSPGRTAYFKTIGLDVRKPSPNLFDNETVKKIADVHMKMPAQVLLRHLTQNGIVAIPKSVTPARIAANISVLDFELTEEEMQQLNGLDMGDEGRTYFMEFMEGADKHPEWPYK